MFSEPEKRAVETFGVMKQIARGDTFVCCAMDGEQIASDLSDMPFQSTVTIWWRPSPRENHYERPLSYQVSCSVSREIPLEDLNTEKEADMARFVLERTLKESSLDFGSTQRTETTDALLAELRRLFPHQAGAMAVCTLASYKSGSGTMTVFAHHPDITTPQALQIYQRATAD